MSNKVKGYVLGILASLAVVALWIVLYVFVGIIAGYIGTLMALSIIMIYKKFNPEDNSNVIYVVAVILSALVLFYYIRQQTKKVETRKVESTTSPVENIETSEKTNESEK